MYVLTDRGRKWLGESDSDSSSASRACIDWTERRHHLGGALGAAVFRSLAGRKWIAAIRGTRHTSRGSRVGAAVRNSVRGRP